MIIRALMSLSGQKGTKKDILAKIEQVYKLDLTNKNNAIYKTLAQALSKYFDKTPQEYMLNPQVNFSTFEIGENPSMKSMIIAAMLQKPAHKGDVKHIKAQVMLMFSNRIKADFFEKTRASSNLQEWEKTFLKTFSRHKDIFIKNKAIYYMGCGSR